MGTFSVNWTVKEWGERMLNGGCWVFVFIFILNSMDLCMYIDNLWRVEMKDAEAERDKSKYEYQWCGGKWGKLASQKRKSWVVVFANFGVNTPTVADFKLQM